MRVALVNPPWTFDKSVYFGCREPHLPLEFGYSKALLEKDGHEVVLVDAQLEALDMGEVRRRVAEHRPEMIVITTAPSYLFWRCAPPELRVPKATADALRDLGAPLVIVGPHASTTPRTTLRKLSADVAVLGECEEVLVRLAREEEDVRSVARRRGNDVVVSGGPHAADVEALPVIDWPLELLERHAHHHHRFDMQPIGPGGELEASRGCPFHCTFCAKDNFRNGFRKRPIDTVLHELDRLLAKGVRYVYFVDEIFMYDRALLEELCSLPIVFGVQMRIDHWKKEALELLGAAGCVSIEAGVESISKKGRSLLAKKCRLSTDEITDLLVFAKQHVPFVQANLLDGKFDDKDELTRFRAELTRAGVWSNDPVPLFAYPGSPEYTLRWGPPDDDAWERAHADYLSRFEALSDIQAPDAAPLRELEGGT